MTTNGPLPVIRQTILTSRLTRPRLRYWFAVTPLEDLVASAGMRLLTRRARPAETRRGLADALLESKESPPECASAIALLGEFSAALARDLARLDPVGRPLAADDEQLLCRYCYLLALFEELFRAGRQIRSPLYELDRRATVADLLALPP